MQKVYVWNGNVYVQWANEGLWYGDKVLVGITNGFHCPGYIWPDLYYWGNSFEVCQVHGDNLPAYHHFHIWGAFPNGTLYYEANSDSDGYFNVSPDYYFPPTEGAWTVYAQDMETGCVYSVTFTDEEFMPGT